MPECARAHGLWGGPEPEVLKRLSYAERKVLRLARVYRTVKRISAHVLPYGRQHPEALPEYSTRNTVAYAQDPEAVMRVLCLTPTELAQDLYVQFEGVKEHGPEHGPRHHNGVPPVSFFPMSGCAFTFHGNRHKHVHHRKRDKGRRGF